MRMGVLGLAWLLAGCTAAQDPILSKIDAAIVKGNTYLVQRQRQDGAWLSQSKPMFRDGYSLTPLVGVALLQSGADSQSVNQATDFMLTLTPEKREDMIFPAYSLAESLVLYARRTEDATTRASSGLVQYLRSQQQTEALGWQKQDLPYGGWGEGIEPYRRPVGKRPLDESRAANLNTTLFVVSGLRAAGVPASDPAVAKARLYVERCQNFPNKDGGFFFSPSHPNRNKAGEFHSYGSTTGDGLRALLLTGDGGSSARVRAARQWLLKNFDADQNPGDFPPERQAVRQALYFYYAASVAQALDQSADPAEDAEAGKQWASALATSLLGKQKADGSWSNAQPIMMEDDPLVATPLALRALAAARHSLKSR